MRSQLQRIQGWAVDRLVREGDVRGTGWATAALALSAVVLALFGWHQVDDHLGLLELAFGTGSLFVFAGTDVEHVPVALGVARLLAPLATVWVAVGLLLASGEERIHQLAARTSVGHDLVIGPHDRVGIYLSGMSDSRVVHLGDSSKRSRGGTIRAAGDWNNDDWVDRCSPGTARGITIATGVDEVNLAILNRLKPILEQRPDLDVRIEIDDRSLALNLAVAGCIEDPDRSTQVICRDDLTAQSAVETVLRGPDAPRSIVVAGHDRTLGLLATHLANGLISLGRQHALERPRLGVACPDDALREKLVDRLGGTIELRVLAIGSLDDIGSHQPPWTGVVIDDANASGAVRTGLELALRFPDLKVWVTSDRSELIAPLRTISLRGSLSDDTITGPFARCARSVHRRMSGDDERHSWETLTPIQRKEATRYLRRLVALLHQKGWRLEPTKTGRFASTTLSQNLIEELQKDPALRDLPHHIHLHSLPGGHDLRDLPHHMEAVGLAIHQPVDPSTKESN